MENVAALITLATGRTYAATSFEFRDGWLHIEGARYWRTGPENSLVRFAAPRSYSWPREHVWQVRTVKPRAEASEGASAAPAAS